MVDKTRATNPYYDESFLRRLNNGKSHRALIGGNWDEMGDLQRDFLISQGLQPNHRLLDIGCGALRLGSKVVDYLDPAGYCGCDLVTELIDLGYDQELTAEQRLRLPRTNLWTTDRFDLGPMASPADFAMAQSVFSHLPPAYLRLCLSNLAEKTMPGARFFATFFFVDDSHPIADDCVQEVPGRDDPVTTSALHDPYHYWMADVRHAARSLPWDVRRNDDWKHPRGQQMIEFRRTS